MSANASRRGNARGSPWHAKKVFTWAARKSPLTDAFKRSIPTGRAGSSPRHRPCSSSGSKAIRFTGGLQSGRRTDEPAEGERLCAKAREKRRGKMRRTLGEWEKLWRERWDINDYADLDQVFAGTEDEQDVLCEVEIILETREGNIETVQISLFDE